MSGFVEKVLERSGFSGINPVQRKAMEGGVLEGKSMVVAAPTASGKTLIAEMAALRAVKEGKKVVYIVPLRALASEKYGEFREKYGKMGIKIAISIGDLDASDPWLAKYDIIIVTSEKFDSLLRHGISWIDRVGLVVVDEIHLLNDPGRGPTLEVMITKMKSLASPQILGLSATISNYREIADWLGAEAVRSDWRPVKLFKGVCFDGKIEYHPIKKSKRIPNDHPEPEELVKDTVSKGKQSLVFVYTRRNTETLAGRLGRHVKKGLEEGERKELEKLSGEILKAIEKPTIQCERLSGVIKDGVAFHHAGITNEQRKIVEDGFRKGVIKAITATPTLAAGINLPAYRVVIRDLKRFSSGYGMDYIPVLEIQQMMGRAGRPKYDRSGEAIIIAKKSGEAEFVWDTYVKGEPEDIKSKLGVAPVLRMHTLALIASEIISSRKGLLDFFDRTFYAYQYGDESRLEGYLSEVLEELKGFGFVKGSGVSGDNPFRQASSLADDERLEATPLGKRVSELYIDPLTANFLITNLEKTSNQGVHPFSVLQLISDTMEMAPGLYLRKGDREKIDELIGQFEGDLLEKPPNPWEMDFEEYLRSVKTAWLFTEWMDEMGEDRILEKFGARPGELRYRLNNADWLLYAAQELGLLLKLRNVIRDIRKVRLRVKYGVREELLPLVRLKGIGRVRSRKLFSGGIRRLSDLRKVPESSLARMIGPKIAKDLKEQLNETGKQVQKSI